MSDPWTPVTPSSSTWTGAVSANLATENGLFLIATEDGAFLLGIDGPYQTIWTVVS